jgi:Sulfotransferase family
MMGGKINAAASSERLRLASLLDKARQRSGLTDFGDEWFVEPLRELVRMINEEAGLTSCDAPPVEAMVKNLADRLQLVEYLKRNPAALDEKVDVAGVIIGLGRGGSTLLQRLLSSSPQVNFTPWWEVVYPVPLPGERRGDPAPRIELGKRTAKAINETWPELVAMHPVDATEADEEITLFDRTPLCMMYSFYFYLPSYMPWLVRQDHRRAYEELRIWLKVLQHQQPARRGKRWLLKSGHHLYGCALRPLLDHFPEALAIMTHRRLQNVIVSYCSLQRVTVQKYSSTFDRKRLGSQAIEVFRAALTDLLAVRREYAPQRFLDVQYQDTVERPLEVHRSTLARMGFELSEADERAAAGWMASHGRDTHPPHRYAAEDYGITAEDIARTFDFYHQAFLPASG